MNRLGWSLLALITAVPSLALAAPGDADDDGITDAADAFPCDWRRSAVAYVPGDGQLSTLLYEDNWPAQGDLDFNDAVVGYSVAVFYDAGGRISGARLTVVPRALGAAISSGLALRLPVPASTAVTITRRIGAGAAEVLAPHTGETSLVVTIAEALRPLFPSSTDLFINTEPTLPVVGNGSPVVVEFEFAQPQVGLAVSSDPFDLFFFRTEAPSHQVHRPQFGGTDRFNGALLGTADDGSTGSRHFVDRDGLPFVLSIPDAPTWPNEHQRIESAWPGIVQFAQSGGLEGQSYWSTNVNVGRLFAGATPASAGGVDLSACFAATCTDGARNGGESDVDCGGTCGACGTGLGCRTHADCGTEVCADGSCVALDTRSCSAANGRPGTQTRSNGVWAACVGVGCTAGFHDEGGVCVSNTRACSIANGTGHQWWIDGSGWVPCYQNGCNAGWHANGGGCEPDVIGCSVANGWGTQTWNGSVYGQCTAIGCDASYRPSGSVCVPTGPNTCWEMGGEKRDVGFLANLTTPAGVTYACILPSHRSVDMTMCRRIYWIGSQYTSVDGTWVPFFGSYWAVTSVCFGFADNTSGPAGWGPDYFGWGAQVQATQACEAGGGAMYPDESSGNLSCRNCWQCGQVNATDSNNEPIGRLACYACP